MDQQGRSYHKKREMAKQQNGKCFYCSLRLGDDMTWEHLVPQSDGGCSKHRNLRIAHMQCNVKVANLPVQAKLILADLGAAYGSDAFFIAAEKVMPHSAGVHAILGSWKRARRMKPRDFQKLTPAIQKAFIEAEQIARELAQRDRDVEIDILWSTVVNDTGPVTALAA